jgi:tetratricopeptide (TPR) repeat protein
MTLGDVVTGRARQDQAAAIGLSGEVDPLTGSLIYCSILWTCRTFADWSRAAQWEPGFELWCQMAYAEITGACRLHNADILASMGRLAEALSEIDRAIQRLIQEGTWELGDAYRVRGDILTMMGDTAGARREYRTSKSLGWDVEPGLAHLVAAEGDAASAIAAIDRSLAGQGWYGRQRQGWLLASKARIAAAASRSEVAKAALEELDQWREAASIPATRAMALEARAELLVREGHLEGAMPVFQLARQLWIGIRHEYHAARLSLRTAELMEQTGDVIGADMERAAARLTAERIGAGGLLEQSSLDVRRGEFLTAGYKIARASV